MIGDCAQPVDNVVVERSKNVPTAIDDNEQLSYARIFLGDVEALKETATSLVADTLNNFKSLTPQHHVRRKASQSPKILGVRGSPKIQ